MNARENAAVHPANGDALVIVDLQNDLLPGGAQRGPWPVHRVAGSRGDAFASVLEAPARELDAAPAAG